MAVIDQVEEFNRSIRWGNRRGEKGLAELLSIITKELLYGGNTFVEMLTSEEPADAESSGAFFHLQDIPQ